MRVISIKKLTFLEVFIKGLKFLISLVVHESNINFEVGITSVYNTTCHGLSVDSFLVLMGHRNMWKMF